MGHEAYVGEPRSVRPVTRGTRLFIDPPAYTGERRVDRAWEARRLHGMDEAHDVADGRDGIASPRGRYALRAGDEKRYHSREVVEMSRRNVGEGHVTEA